MRPSPARPLFLHASALSPDEYGPLVALLQDLLPPSTTSEALEAEIRVDDVGRYLMERLHVDLEIWEDILTLFHPSHTTLQPRFATSQSHLRTLTPLKGGQVLVVLRLVAHASAGRAARSEGLDLVFRQSTPPPELFQAPSAELFDAYLAKKRTKPLPPPQHLHRRTSTNNNTRKEMVAMTPPSSPPPRRLSARLPAPPPPPPPQEVLAPPRTTNLYDSPQGMTHSDSEYLQKVTGGDEDSSSASFSSDDGDEGPAQAERSHFTPPSSSGARKPSNPFRSRLQSVPAGMISSTNQEPQRTLSSGQDALLSSPFSPPLPPRPLSGTTRNSSAPAPPLPARDQPSRRSYPLSSSSSLSEPYSSSKSHKPAPPQTLAQNRKPPAPPRAAKPDHLTGNIASAFKTTPLIHQSLAAASDARREAEHAPDRERRFEVIGSSSPTKERGPAARVGRTRSGSGASGGTSGAGSKWVTVNGSIGFGRPGHKSHASVGGAYPTLARSSPHLTSSSSPSVSPAPGREGSGAEYPFPVSRRASALNAPTPPPPPPPIRRASLQTSHSTRALPASTGNRSLARHASLSSRLSERVPDDLRGAVDHSLRSLGHAATSSAGVVHAARKGVPVEIAAAGWGAAGGRGDRERLMDRGEDDDSEGDSADEGRRELRERLERTEGYHQLS